MRTFNVLSKNKSIASLPKFLNATCAETRVATTEMIKQPRYAFSPIFCGPRVCARVQHLLLTVFAYSFITNDDRVINKMPLGFLLVVLVRSRY